MNLQAELKSGKEIQFSNEEHQMNIGEDDIRIATVELDTKNTHEWAKGFKIWFNGELLHCSKTFKPMKKRLSKLINKWNLKQIEI